MTGPLRLDAADPAFAAAFDALVAGRREAEADVARDVRAIVQAVRDDGDAAVAAYTKRFDGHDLADTGWRVEPADLAAAHAGLSPSLRDALELAHARITAWHERQRPADTPLAEHGGGIRLGARWRAARPPGT